tara:strand:- start:8795 stop:9406 length:612 start_codon:yes stop_codon:yes gene_type:complete
MIGGFSISNSNNNKKYVTSSSRVETVSGSNQPALKQINIIYRSDFSNDADGFNFTIDGSVEGGVSAAGKDGLLKCTLGSQTASQGESIAFKNSGIAVSVPNGSDVKMTFLYYFPSTKEIIIGKSALIETANIADSISGEFDDVQGDVVEDSLQDVWHRYNTTITTSGLVTEVPKINITGGSVGNNASEGDIVYIKDMVIWYET